MFVKSVESIEEDKDVDVELRKLDVSGDVFDNTNDFDGDSDELGVKSLLFLKLI